MSQPAEPEQNFIDGHFVAVRGESIAVENPATQATIGHIPDSDAEVVNTAVAAARRAQPAWEKRPAIERAGYLRQIIRTTQFSNLYLTFREVS